MVGEDTDDVGAALDLFVEPLERVGRPDLLPVRDQMPMPGAGGADAVERSRRGSGSGLRSAALCMARAPESDRGLGSVAVDVLGLRGRRRGRVRGRRGPG